MAKKAAAKKRAARIPHRAPAPARQVLKKGTALLFMGPGYKDLSALDVPTTELFKADGVLHFQPTALICRDDATAQALFEKLFVIDDKYQAFVDALPDDIIWDDGNGMGLADQLE